MCSPEHVREYDLSRRHSLHLSYWTDGDTRRRGETLLRFKQMYRDSGMFTVLNGELPGLPAAGAGVLCVGGSP